MTLMKKTKKKARDITTFNKRVIDFLTSPLILVSLLIALCLPLILMWAKSVDKKQL